MDSVKQLWFRRFSYFGEEAVRYLRIIVTGYLYLPIVLLISLAFLYRYLLAEWKESGLLLFLLSFLFTWILAHSPARTFLQEADLVYLLPLEKRMKPYFRLSLMYSFAVQALYVLFFLLLLSPLLSVFTGVERWPSAEVLAALLLFKGWNVYAQWQEQRWRESSYRSGYTVVRWLVNLLFAASAFHFLQIPVWVIGIGILMLTGSYVWISRKMGYHWIRLLENERKREAVFYSFVQWFMDVPRILYPVKRRDYWVALFRWMPFHPQWAYSYLFSRSFVRYSDLFCLYWRMYILGAVLVYFVHPLTFLMMTYFGLLMLNSYQLSQAWHRLQATFWGAVYPLSQMWKVKGFLRVLFLLLSFQAIGLALVSGIQHGWVISLALLTSGVVFSYLVAFYLVGRKWGKSGTGNNRGE